MKAVQFSGHGGREVIEYGEVERPEPGPGEALVDVKAGAVNHLDVWTRRGLPGLDLEMPHTPGSDVAGVVEAVGAGVDRVDAGDRVCLLAGVATGEDWATRHGDPTLSPSYEVIGEHRPGVHAEYAAVPADNLLPVPGGVDWETAAAAPLVFSTAWRMLVVRGNVRPGEDVLVLGASGGVGHAAVQIAADAGATVYATGSSEAKLERARALGAEHACNYEDRAFHRWAREQTDGRGMDCVVDHVGADTFDDSLKALRKGGRVLTCGATTGPTAEVNVNRVFWNQLEVVGSTMATPGEAEDALAEVWDGTYEVALRETLPMSETARAHELLEDRQGFGKVVVIPDSEL